MSARVSARVSACECASECVCACVRARMCLCVCLCVCVCVCAISVYDTHALLKLCDAPLQVVDSYYYLHYNRSNYINCADEKSMLCKM